MIFAVVRNGTFTSYPSVLAKIQKIETKKVGVSDGDSNKVKEPVVNLYDGSSAKLKKLLEISEKSIQKFKSKKSQVSVNHFTATLS